MRVDDTGMANDIGEFLTSRRATVTPEQAGLPSYGKRRVAGLRREEVASLAGVSVDYYRRLERGLVSGVSDGVLEALAGALQLDDAERAHLHDLARAANPVAPKPRRTAQSRVRPTVQRILDALDAPASEIVEAHWTAERRARERFRCEQPPYSILVRAIEHDVLPTCRRHGMGVIPYSPLAGGWLSGRYRKDAELAGPTSSARPPARFDLSDPANERKLDAAEELARLADEAGMTLVEMAVAFVLRHPAVTAAIIGPRTVEHLSSQLAAADVTLSDDVLDRIDAINPPGVTINPVDNGWTAPSLQPAGRRR